MPLELLVERVGFAPQTVTLEHSLLAISKWESVYHKPFFDREEKTKGEMFDYVQMMVVSDNPPPNLGKLLTNDQHQELANYIANKASATWFSDDKSKGPPPRETLTSELIYYWLVGYNIPFDPVETWHFNRLMNLVRIAGIKQTAPKKMTKQSVAQQYRELNAQRRRESGSSG